MGGTGLSRSPLVPSPVTVRRPVVGLALLLLVVTGFLALSTRAAGHDASLDRCARLAAESVDRLADDTGGSGPRIVVIGDSYSVGLGLDRPLDSWPSRLPGRVHVAGFSGSGFSADASPCPHSSYAERAGEAVRGGTALVVVEGGLNDVDRSDAAIRAGFVRLHRALGDALGDVPVLVVGPVAAPSRADAVPRVDRLLADLAARHGVDYLSMTGVGIDYLPDRLHPTAAGHAAFGEVVAAEVTRLGAADVSPARRARAAR